MPEHDWLHEYTSGNGQVSLAGLIAHRAAQQAVPSDIGHPDTSGRARRQHEQRQLARFLETLGVVAGDTVAILLRDPSQLPLALGAAIAVRGKALVVEAGIAGATLSHALAHNPPRVIITETCCTALLLDSDAPIVALDTDAGYWADPAGDAPRETGGREIDRDLAIAVVDASGQHALLSDQVLLADLAILHERCPLPADGVLHLGEAAGPSESVLATLWSLLSGASLRREPQHARSAGDGSETLALELARSRVLLRTGPEPAMVSLGTAPDANAAASATVSAPPESPVVLRDDPLLLGAGMVAGRGAAVSIPKVLPVRLAKALARFAGAAHVSVPDLLMAVWAALLHRYTDEARIVLATLANEAGMDAIVPARIVTASFAEGVSFRSLLLQLKTVAATRGAAADQRIENELAQARHDGFNRLSQYVLRYCGKGGKGDAERNRVDQHYLDSLNLDLICRFELVDKRIRYVLTCREPCVASGLIERLTESFEALAQHGVEQPDADIAALPVLSARQFETQIHAWNATEATFEETACVHQLFERQAALRPDAQAIYDHASACSYGELNERANRLARFVGELSVSAATHVCVMLDRQVDIPVALLAILKSGNAYVPLDAQHPAPRNAGIVREQAATIIITHACFQAAIGELAGEDCGIRHVIYLDALPHSADAGAAGNAIAVHGPDAWARHAASNLSVAVASGDLAYTIFTSGSTGKPKGVMVRHRPVINLIEWVNRTFSVGPDDTLLFVTSLCFDLSVYDIFGVLAAGGRIRVASPSAIRDARALLDLLQHEPITFWDSAPANLQRLVPLLRDQRAGAAHHHLRLVFLSGDWIPVKLPDTVRAAFPRARVISLGGATEATVWSNYFPIGAVGADWGSIPYGRPIQNARYYILNRHLQPCPANVAGDLYIGGLCLADGYTSEALTRRSFIRDPFVAEDDARMYRTGDLARFEADGTMIFLGRADTQVKVRGFRVELGEIEVVLQKHPAVDHAVVLLQDRNTPDPRIVAYVASAERTLDHLQLRAYLEKLLPEPMLPNFSLVMPSLPVSSNGKVDRAVLPWPLPSAASRPQWPDAAAVVPVAPVAPAQRATDEVRRQVFEIVTELLHHGEVGSSTSLFEAGATSLTIVFLAERIKQQYGVEIPIDRFLAEPTIDLLLQLLVAHGVAASAAPPPAPLPALPPAAAAPASQPPPSGVPPIVDAAAQAHSVCETPPAWPVAAAGLDEAIALIGVHFNFPGANDFDSFWQKLSGGYAFYGPLPPQRRELWNGDPVQEAGAVFVGAYVDDIDCFDHRFFNISAPEARSMDPQERRLMESAWRCLEDAGYCSDDARLGRVGVYCGVMRDDYASIGIEHWNRTGQTAFASNASGVSNRISHSLDLKGPSLTVNTSCASAMTALHLACNALRHGECEAALVGGVNLFAHPYHQAMLHSLRFASARGSAEPFAASADGWVPGEGVATVLLKPSREAIRDRDPIYAHILGTAIGHMGSTLQYAAPSSAAQGEGMRELLQATGLTAADIDLVECCAAGAAMGDAAEFSAVQQVIAGSAAPRAAACYLGTSKDYLGHLESASALAQIVKALLQLRHGQLIPLRSRAPLSPLVVAKSAQVQLLTEARPWPLRADGRARTVLVNSNGAGGATAHLLLAEHSADAGADAPTPAERELIVLSSMSEVQLREQAEAVSTFVALHKPALADVAFTLAAGRRHHEVRLALVVGSVEELAQCLAAFVASPPQGSGDRFAARAIAVAGGWFGAASPDQAAPDQAHAVRTSPPALASLARQWVDGEASLGRLIAGLEVRRGRRISLPGYRFARHRHWLPVNATGAAPSSGLPAAADAGAAETPGSVLHRMAGSDAHDAAATSADTALARANLQRFLVELVAQATETPVEHVHPRDNTQRFGLNSLSVAYMTRQLGGELGAVLEPTLFFAHKTVADLAAAVFAAQQTAVLARFGEAARAAANPAATAHDAGRSEPPVVSAAALAPPAQAAYAEPLIAVVGVAGRYPGAADLIEFWENLRQGRDCISDIPAERWCADDYLPDGVPLPAQGATRSGGFIGDVDKFDPLFFGIAPSTADFMDPQVRLFLQTAWEALEDAGHRSACLQRLYGGEVGVFVGVMHGEYQLHDAHTAEGVRHIGGVSYGSVAHQVSYTLDLSGPSMAVDTMCSASLTALHLAIDSIRRDECKAAIVGGVNLSIHPNKYIQQSLMTMHASSGRCRSFAADGDGFIPAEGVGAILIKPLDAALRHRDQIYGVIRGSHLNSGGKTYGYTVPNPTAQAALIETALRKAGLDPSAVSYIEAHGTGTSLGDPIEISGLTQAFHRCAQDESQLRARGQFCAIGSVKSNIGHCESAAGIAGLTKVLLQLKHGLLVPSLHAAHLNPTIDFARSPFRVQRELAPWTAPQWLQDGVRKQAPRIAGISSFGAGGANAHVLVEEFTAADAPRTDTVAAPALVLLSARSRAQLERYAARLTRSIEAYGYGDADLPSIAYTLAVGRDEHAHRLALVAHTLAGLLRQLDEFVAGGSEAGYRQLTARRSDDAVPAELTPQRVLDLLVQGELRPLAESWLRGQEIDWQPAYEALPARLTKRSLATYPFLQRSCWIGGRFEPRRKASAVAPVQRLHPLVHTNVSDFGQYAFLSTFTRDEFVLRDHVLGGRQLLPGVAHLEMARAAASLLGAAEADETVACLRGVVWMQPVVLEDSSVSVRTELRRDAHGKLRFQLLSRQAGQPDRIHSQGEIESLEAPAPPLLDMAPLRALCGRQRIAADAFYDNARSGGAQYGPAFQALGNLAISQDGARPFVLADLQLPASVAGDGGAYRLHPSILDGALQAVAALSGIAYPATQDPAGTAGMSLPFALEEMRVYSACPAQCVVWARPSEIAGAAGAPVSRFDIDIADGDGRVAVAMRGYTTRMLPAAAMAAAPLKGQTLTVLAAEWNVAVSPPAAAPPVVAEAVVCLIGLRELAYPVSADGRLWHVDSDRSSPEARYGDFVAQLIDVCRRVAAAGAGPRTLCVVVQSDAADGALMSGLGGLLASITREYASLDTRLFGFQAVPAAEALHALLMRDAGHEAKAVFYAGAGRLERRLVPLTRWQQAPAYRWPAGGVYLITGGLGGIGRSLVRYLAGTGQRMTLVLVGRRPMDREAQAFIDAVGTASLRIVYEPLDVADEASVTLSLANLRQHYGAFTGVLHCAGVSRDSFIANKTAQEIRDVLAAKVAGVANLDRATQHDPLAFFVAFSSLSSLFGNPGQADYAAANGYLDGFMHERAQRVRAGQGTGHSASVNWPFWQNGGMQPGTAARAQMAQQQMLPMTDADAVAVLEHLALAGSGQWAVISREPAAPTAGAAKSAVTRVARTAPAARRADTAPDALEQLQRRLLQEVSAQLKIDTADLDADSDFSEYGFDSISLTEFANRINQATGLSLLPTIFFEHPSIAAFANHLLAEYGSVYGGPAPVAAHARADAAGGGAAQPPALSAPPLAAIRDALHAHVLSTVSSLLKIDAQELDLDAELSEYGFDSINLTELSNRLQAFFDVSVMPTLFFEHPTLRRFCDYLEATHRHAVMSALAPAAAPSADVPAPAIGVEAYRPAAPLPPEPRVAEATPAAPRPHASREPVAIIGMSGAFPQARDVDVFWDNLVAGRDGIGEIPPDRWDWREVYGDPLTQPNKTNIKWGGFIDGVGDFDPAFFGISPREALYMDPQQRLLMLHVWHAIEDAGHAPESLAGSDTAIFVGTTVSGYVNLIAQSGHAIQSYSATGVSPSVGPNRLSYLLDLHGPSEPIETACSSSLVAIHRAVTALRMHQCGLAIAGGVNTIVTPEVHMSFNKAGMLSEDGRCKTFSRNADGYSRGEGVGMLVLRRLEDAQRDRDPIYGVILASAENHGGKANTLTSPNPVSQAMLLKAAYREAAIDPRTVTYIECHGTGTELGDPVEINGLKSAFHELYDDAVDRHGPFTSAGKPAAPWCGLASVKSNVGHLEYAAGVAGVIKVLLQMRHRTLVPSLHSLPRNPYIELEGSPFEILSERRPWAALHDAAGRALPRRAGVSSYGFGGVNAHVVIEEYLAPAPAAAPAVEPVAIVLSARTAEQLVRQAVQLRDAIARRGHADSDLANIAYTLQVGRNAMRWRFACGVQDVATLQEILSAFADGQEPAGRWIVGDSKTDKAEVSAFARDVEFQALVSSWAVQRKYPQLLKLWVSGHAIDWACGVQSMPVRPSRIRLPGYAFELKRYWIDAVPPDGAAAKDATVPVPAPVRQASVAPAASAAPPSAGRDGKPRVRLAGTGRSEAVPVGSSPVPAAATSSQRPNESPGRAAVVLAGLDGAQKTRTATALPPAHPPVTPSTPAGNVATPRAPAPSAEAVLARLRQSLADALFMDIGALDIELPFKEMGLDSVTGVEWVQSVDKTFGIKIAAAEVFNFPTLFQFATFVADKLAAQPAVPAAGGQASAAAVASPATPPAPIAVAVNLAVRTPPTSVTPATVSMDEVTQFLKAQLVKVLYLETEVQDLDLPFSDLGLDSVTGVEWVQTINARFSIKLPTGELFSHPTLRQLGERICAAIQQRPEAAAAPAVAIAGADAPQGEGAPPTDDESPPTPAAAGHPPRTTPPTPGDGAGHDPHAVAGRVPAPAAGTADQVAVIGMACRFADASSPAELWRNLASGRDSVRRADRWPDCDLGGQPLLGSFLSAIDRFDPMFFKISASEAKYMDPQQRIFLEECWKAIEDAGYAGCIEGSNCGVYTGCGNGDYGSLMATAPPQAFWGNAMSVIASRISYYLDLQGPAVAIDTACSSSLVAIHTACRALVSGEVDMALAGGVTVLSTPSMIGNAAGAGMLSPTGHCHSFDSRADGFVAGEGAGVLLLKRLDDALRDNDNIHGVIRGSAINQDGLTNGITAPSAKSQERLETGVYTRFAIDPGSITLVEAHGTGTILGDPIEFQALCTAFRRQTPRTQFCALGSIKSNIGHTIAAAGVAGVLKVLLALKHRLLPPSLHYRHGNPAIDFAQSPFYVNTQLQDWNVAAGEIRRAAVSSFGFSGTNAHMVIDEAPVQAAVAPTRRTELVVLSAHSPEQVIQMADALADHLDSTPASLTSVAYTLAVGRRQLPYRLAIVASSMAGLVSVLRARRDEGSRATFRTNFTDPSVLAAPGATLAPLTLPGLAQETGLGSTDPASTDALLEQAAAQFLRGRRIDFGSFFSVRPRRVSLPVYTFADERYWVDPPAPVAVAVAPVPPARAAMAPVPVADPPATSDEDWLLESLYKGELSVDEVLKTLS